MHFSDWMIYAWVLWTVGLAPAFIISAGRGHADRPGSNLLVVFWPIALPILLFLLAKGLFMTGLVAFPFRALLSRIIWMGIGCGIVPATGFLQDAYQTWSRLQAELPANASPLAQKVYQQLGNAEGWTLSKSEEGIIHLQRGNTRIAVNGSSLATYAGERGFDAFTSRERSAIASRAAAVRDKILEMRRDALARELFREDKAQGVNVAEK